MDLISAARKIALHEHALQFYPPKHGPVTFAMHLGHAVSVLDRFGVEDPVIHAATWLHDIIEDTPTTVLQLHEDLRAYAGSHALEVVRIVDAVTDEPGANRAERKAKTYPRIMAAGPRAVTVKLADRIANVEASLLGGRGVDYLAMYKREHPAFQEALYSPLSRNLWPMWIYLDTLIESSVVTPTQPAPEY